MFELDFKVCAETDFLLNKNTLKDIYWTKKHYYPQSPIYGHELYYELICICDILIIFMNSLFVKLWHLKNKKCSSKVGWLLCISDFGLLSTTNKNG